MGFLPGVSNFRYHVYEKRKRVFQMLPGFEPEPLATLLWKIVIKCPPFPREPGKWRNRSDVDQRGIIPSFESFPHGITWRKVRLARRHPVGYMYL